MKKVFIYSVTALCLMLSAVACSSNSNKANDDDDDSNTEKTESNDDTSKVYTDCTQPVKFYGIAPLNSIADYLSNSDPNSEIFRVYQGADFIDVPEDRIDDAKKIIEAMPAGIIPDNTSIMIQTNVIKPSDEDNFYTMLIVDKSDFMEAVPAEIFVNTTDQIYPTLSINLTPEKAEEWKRFTANHIDRAVGIVIGDNLLSAPRVVCPIEGGKLSISGNFDVEQLKIYRDILRGK